MQVRLTTSLTNRHTPTCLDSYWLLVISLRFLCRAAFVQLRSTLRFDMCMDFRYGGTGIGHSLHPLDRGRVHCLADWYKTRPYSRFWRGSILARSFIFLMRQ